MNDRGPLIPEDEEARLQAVRRYDILDTPPDGAFDRVTAMAARHFGVPISIVSIVDSDRIWFKSHHGAEVEETGRDPGLCASAILHDGPWVVEDATIDPRALANPLVAGDFGLRFYAGVPLTTGDGHNLGTLCLLDTEPRVLTDDEAATLTDMAAIVMDELELRLSARTAIEREQVMRRQSEQVTRILQESLLPASLPEIPGLDVAALYRPADASEVGGDFYDVFETGDGWALVIGDVSGKGPSAAAVTALARHTIRTASLSLTDPAEVLAMLNRAMFLGRNEDEFEHFCTVHLTLLTARAEGGFMLCSAAAGHPPALLRRLDEPTGAITTQGPPVGWHDQPEFTTTGTVLLPGDVLLLYTDGFSEARRGKELLGEEGLRRVLDEDATETADGLSHRLLDLLAEPGLLVRDDAAAVLVRAV